jgi:hypothetical protein
MKSPTLPAEGGCRCGHLRFRLAKAPLLTSACHCTGCQKMSSSAYSLTIMAPADGFEVLQGEPVIGGLHGPMAHHHFCPHCMSWVFTRAEGMDWFVNVRATMLDDPSWFEPFMETFTGEGLAWAKTPARHSFPTLPEPDGWRELMAAYGEATAKG